MHVCLGSADSRQGSFDREVVAERAVECRVAHRHADVRPAELPFWGVCAVVAGGGEEDVVEAFGVGVRHCGIDLHVFAFCEALLVRFVPAPGVELRVACGAVDGQVEVCGGDGVAAGFFDFVFCGAEGGVRVQDAPDVADGRVCFYYAVGEREGDHVEVAQANDEVATFGGGAHKFGDFPGLGGAVAYVRVVGFGFVGGVELSDISE